MHQRFFFLLLFVFLTPAIVQAQAEVRSSGLNALVEERERFFRQFATDSLKPLGDFSEEKYAARYAFSKQFAEKLKGIDTGALHFDDRISYELLRFITNGEMADYERKAYLNPILSDAGFHISLSGRVPASFRNQQEVDRYFALLEDIPRYVREHQQLMRRGLALGICQPPVIIQSFQASYNTHVVSDPGESFFYRPFKTKPASISPSIWQQDTTKARQLIRDIVVPQYKNIQAFFEGEYLSKTKQSLGVDDFPKGKEYYQQRVAYFTTTRLSYDEVYAIGLKEVARIRQEMMQVLEELRFEGDLPSFIRMLRTDERFYPKTADELLKEASYIAKQVDGKLPQFFGKLPRLPYTVAPVPADLAPNYTGGRYSPGRGTKAGEYWVNTYNLPARSLYNLEALTLHEAVPGHHLQMALSLELENVPAFRRNLYVNAFGEGWALYCEWLGTEMGFYKNAYSRFGKLTYEMWRACRLVVDVGIHTKKWTRQQAVDYLASNTALSMHEINTEVDRYIAWPGQALSYKMGELKIRELRARAERELGSRFEIKEFHDLILSKGTVTLDILEWMVTRYLAQKKKA
jgi:uncharacterized protein (DUF885 family)